jgi:hypothetical protein
MSTRKLKSMAGACLAVIAAASLVVEATAASAQDYNNGPPPGGGYDNGPPPGGGYNNGPPPGGGYPSDSAPPQGQYAPPPPGYEQGGAYDDQSQQADQRYAAQYSQWAAQYCVDRHNNNVAAGAVIGGVLGAALGAAAGGRNPGAGAALGGLFGAGTGAAIGSTSSPGGGCPPGYVIRAGAPAFYWGGPGVVAWAPAWYHPWVWAGGRWVYHPYRSWYWGHRGYWHPGWRGRPYRERRW